MNAMQRLIGHEWHQQSSLSPEGRGMTQPPPAADRRRGGTYPLWAVLSAGGCGRKPMKLNELFADDDAVSPVIGVILMVAITVILAAVIGTFVLGLGSEVQETPAAQFTFDEPGTSGNVDVTHDGGDPITADNVEVVDSNDQGPFCNSGSTDWGSTEITAGNSCPITGQPLDGDEGTLRVTWTSDDGSTTDTLATYDYDFS